MNESLLTIQEAATLLGVSPTTLRRWEERKVLLPYRTAGNQRRYSKEQLLAFKQNGFKPVQSAPASSTTTPAAPVVVASEPVQSEEPIVTPTHEAEASIEKLTAPQTPTNPVVVPQTQTEANVQVSDLVSQPRQDVFGGYKMPSRLRDMKDVSPMAGVFAVLVLFVGFVLVANLAPTWGESLDRFGKGLLREGASAREVLAANDNTPVFVLRVNIPSVFGKQATFLDSVGIRKGLTVDGIATTSGGIVTNNSDIDAGTGRLTASNVVYSVLAGTNISVTGDPQNPTISANLGSGLVRSFQGQTGEVALAQGSGIGLDGLTITNTGVLSLQGQTGALNFTQGAGITLNNLTITNSDPGSGQKIFSTFNIDGTPVSAGSNTDTFNFAAGSGITLSTNTTDKTLTISANGSATSQWTTTGSDIYYNLGNVGIGNTAPGATLDVTGNGRFSGSLTVSGLSTGIVKADSNGLLSTSALNLSGGALEVTGVLPVANGGTGLASIPTNGQLLIGNGTDYTLGNLTGTVNQITISNGAGSITFSTPQDIHTAASPTFATLNLTNSANQIVFGSGLTGTISMDPLTTGRTYTFPDASGTVCLTSGNCSGGGGGGISGSGTTNYIAKFTSSSGISDSSIYDNGRVGIGTTSPEGLLTVSGGPAGKALAVFNYTGSGQNILTASASGTTRLTLNSSGDLNIIGGSYQIGGTPVLTSTSLGSGVVSSSLTSVGALNSGSITSGFGNIDVGADAISGGDITSTGSVGFISTGNGAGLNFSGTGNHDVTASSGVLRLGAVTLTGALTGNGQNATGFNNLSASGTVTFGALGTGVVQSNGSGLLSSSALNLAGGTSYVTGVLPVTNGGTGLNSFNTGDLVYASAGNTLAALPIGTEGQVLAVSGAGTPTWISSGTLNYWQRGAGTLAPLNISDDLLVGGVATNSAKFQVFGISGNASTSGTFTFNTAGVIQSTNNQGLTIGGGTTGNITLSPQNGNGTVTSTGNLNLVSGKAYQINGSNVLTETTLGSGVTNSSLTSVGALSAGSITMGFGTINNNNTITGTTLNGTIGVNTGAGAGTQRIDTTGNLTNIGTTQFNGITYSWPGSAGSNNYVLTTDGSGDLTWNDPATLPGVGDITAIGDVISGAAFTAGGTQGTSLYFYDTDGRGQLTIANLTSPRTYTLPDASGEICLDSGNCAGAGGGIVGTGTAGQLAFFTDTGTISSETSGFAWDAINKKLGIGTDTPTGKLSVSGAAAGKALAIFDELGNQDIFSASASGITQLRLARNGDLAIEGMLSDLTQNALTVNDSLNLISGNMFQINGTSVLSASTLGSGVINSSLTSVGALTSGSIANGFGSIFTSNTIQGSDITASGTTGFTATGNGAGLTFSGSGNHSISASSGTLQIGAATLTGDLTGNSQSIVGVNNLSASGTITFGGLSTGIVKSNGSGVLSSSAVNLASGDITGTLATGNGGTGITSVGSAGGVAYSNGSTFAFTGVGSNGEVLISNGSGAPTWASPSSLGTNYWQRNAGLLAPLNIADDLAIGGTSTASAKFQIFGNTGNASTSGSLTFNAAGNIQTTNNQTLTVGGNSTGNIIFSPLNGAGTVLVNGTMNLASGNNYQINGINVLTATTLGTGVVNSSLTNVGALTGGSIANGFGTIATTSTITGTTINGTTGLNTGAGSGTQRVDTNGNLVNIGTTQFNGVTYTWPGSDGSSDYVLTTNSTGGLSWKNVTSVGGAGDITAIGDVISGAAFTAGGTQGTSLYFYDTDGRGQLTIANLTAPRTYTLPDESGEICLDSGNCAGSGGGLVGSGTAGQIAFFDGTGSLSSETSGFSWDALTKKLGIGTDTPTGKLTVSGAAAGKALAVFDETGNQDIITASASGTTQFVLSRNGNLAIEGQLSDLSQNTLTVNDNLNLTTGNEFQINGVSILSASTLGSSVINSSLTSVGALTSGSIASGFGSILTGSTIQGSDITASGTTGFTATGTGAGLTFSGSGNHIVSASSGTLQIGAATLTGAITGNSQSITGLNNLSAAGTITFGGLSTGIVKSNGSGVLSSSAVDLSSGDVTSTLPVGNGGTGQTSFTTNGVVYGNGASALSVTSAPTGGQVLLGNGSGVPTFTTISGGVTISNTGVATIALSSSGDTANTSSNSGLEFNTTDGLSLLRGCANDEILKWNDSTKAWVCATDAGGSGSAGTINVQNNDIGVGSNVDTVDFSTDFTVTASPSNEANVSIADDILDFSEFIDNMTLDAATSIATSNFNLTLGTNAGTGGVVVSPNAGGNSALIVNKQGTGDIFTASASGTTRLTLSNSGDLNITGGNYQIGGTTVLSSNTLGSGVTNSSLTTVGALNAGSITSGFGAIDTGADAISGGDITSTGTTGLAVTGNDADLLFSGTGNHLISASAGTLQLGAATLTGAITGNGQNITGLGNLSASGTVTFGGFTTDGGLLYTNGSGVVAQTAQGTAGQCLQSNGGGAPVWGSCAAGSINYWNQANGALSPMNSTVDFLIGGSASNSAKFAVLNVNSGTPTASVSAGATGATYLTAAGTLQTTNNQTLTIGGNTTGNILLAPLAGAGTVTSTGHLNLASGKEFQINGTSVLTGSTLGAGVVNSSLTSVGALASGSIANGFGSIFTSSTIQGTDITASGATGFTASGNDADLTFSGTGNHTITASGGTLQLGATTLIGAITGNSQNITGLNNLSAAGTITFSGLSTGIVKSNGSGVLSSSAIDLASGDVTGTLAVGNGGTGVTSVGSAGSVAYSNGSSYAFTGVGSNGQVLISNGSGAPSWTDAASVGTNYWQRIAGALSPLSITDDLLIGGTSTASAKFQVFSGTGNATTSGNLTFNGLGVIQTTNNNTLTLGGNTTGNIVLNPLNGSGNVRINGLANCDSIDTDASGNLICGSDAGGGGGAGIVNIQNNDSPVGSSVDTIDFSSDFLVTASPSTEANVSIADDIINFTEIADSLTLDAATSIALSNFDLTLGTNSGIGGIVVAPNAGGNSALIINKQGTGDIFTASAAGTTRFTLASNGNMTATGTLTGLTGLSSSGSITFANFTNNGGLLYTDGSGVVAQTTAGGSGQCLISNGGGAPTWGSCAGGLANYWNQANGVLTPVNSTVDFLIGGQASNSAKFAVLNVNSGTPIASVSAGSTGGISLAANGTIGTTDRQSLTIGNSTTGNVVLNGFGAGIVKTNASGVLSSSAIGLATADVTGTLPVANGGTGQTSFTTNGVVYGNGGSALSVTSAPTGGQVLLGNGSGVPTFTSISGGITLSNTGVATIALTSSGDTVNTSSNSGLEFSTANGLSILRGCNDGQILKWNDTTKVWACGSDAGGTGGPAGVVNVENNDSGVGTDVDTIDFGTDFLVTASPANEANVSIADDVINFTELADSLSLDAATQIALGGFNLTLGTNAGTGGVVVAPNAGGNSALIVNKQGTGDIFTASSSGTTRLTLSSNGDLNIVGGAYMIGGTSVLSSNTLGSGIINSSLTSVGALNAGSITSGFGAIDTGADNISGGNITATGTTGFTGSGNGAGLTFSGTGNHDISASGGVLRLGATTLTGAITGNGQNLTGLANLAASGSITFGGLTTDGGLLYTNGSGVVAQTAAGTGGQCLMSNGGGAPTWGNCTGGLANYWNQANGVITPMNSTVDFLVGGQASNSAKFAVLNVNTGTPTASVSAGSAGAAYLTAAGTLQTTANQTLTIGGNTTGNITLSPLAGAGIVNLTGSLNLASGKEFQINGASVLNATTLGSSVVTSSLTTVGALNAGSITSGFGSIDTGTDAISGGNITSTGTTGFTASGNGAGLAFSGTGNHDISASSGVLRLGATTLTGAITGNSQNITGVANLGTTGTVTFGSFTTDGGLLYTNGSGVVAQTAQGTSGQCLQSNAGGAPTWGSCTGSLANYWNQNNGALSAMNSTVDLLVGGQSSASAKFAILNVNSGTPTASVSAGSAGGASLTADGVLGTTARQSLTLGNSTTGNIVLNGFTAGVVKTNASGVLSSSAIGLATADVTGTLPVGNGGTGATTLTQGGVLYGNGTSPVAASAQGTAGQALLSGGTGAPTWTTGTLALAGNFSTSGANALTLTTTGATNVTLPTTGTLATLAGTETLSGKTLTAPRFVNGGFIADANGNEQLIFGTTASAINELTLTNAAAGGTVTLAATGGDSNIPFAIDAKGTGELRLNGTGTGNVLLGGGFGGTGCTVTNSTGAFACNGAVTGSNISGTTSGTNTGDQTITLTGDVTGSGTGSFATVIADNSVDGTDIALGSDATGDLMYYNGTDWVRLAAGTSTQLLHSGTTPSWGAVSLTADITGVLGSANGGTGANLSAANQGAVPYFSATGVMSALAPGTAGYVLTTNGAGQNPTWSNAAALGTNYWNLANGSLSPVNNTLDLLIGGQASNSAKFAVLNVNSGTPTASVSAGSAGAAYLTAAGALQTTVNQTLSLGGNTTGNIVLNSDGNNFVGIGTATPTNRLTVAGNIEALNGTQQSLLTDTGSIELARTSDDAFIDFKTSTAEDFDARIEGFGGGLAIRTGGSGTQQFVFENGGNLGIGTLDPTTNLHVVGGARITGLANCNTIDTDANGVLSCGTDESGGVQNFWNLNQGTLAPVNSTVDLLIGGTSSSSAKFAILNVNSGTPTASVSAGSAGGASLTATGVLGTTARQSLTLGNNTTGNIVLNGFTAGVVKTNASGVLSSSAIGLATADVTGTLPVGNGGTGATTLTQGGILYGNGTSPVAASAQGTSGQALLSGGTGAPTWTTGALALAGDFTTSGANALTLTTTGTTNVTLPTTGTLATLAGTETLSGKTLTAPRFVNGGFIADANGNEQLIFGTTASAINELTLTNAAAAGAVTLAATGGDSNIPFAIDAKGTGELRLNGTGTGNVLLGGGFGGTGCTVTNSNGNFACNGTLAGSNFSGSTSGTNTGDQTITLTGDVTGTGTGSFGTTIADNSVDGTDIALGSDATGDLMYYNGTDWTRLAAGTGNQLLHSGTTPSWGAVDLTTQITGTLPIANGGTNSTATPTNGGVAYGTGTAFAFTSAGTNGDCFKSNGAAAPTWGSCGGANYWNLANGAFSPVNSTADILIGGTASSSAKFAVLNMNSGTPTASVSATATGNGLSLGGDAVIQSLRNNTLTIGGNTTGNITLSPQAGSGTVTSTGNLNLSSGKEFQINGASILSASTLGSSVVTSSLTTVGVLNSGSINTGFGAIDVGSDNIAGGNITAAGTTGYASTGNGAGLTFSGTGNHDITASVGVLRLGALTLTGTITGNTQSITGLGQLTVDNLRLDNNTLDTTTGDLTLAPNGGDVIFNDATTLNIGGNASDVAYNIIGDTITGANGNMGSDDDLFIEGDLQTLGTIFGNVTGNLTGNVTGNTFTSSSGDITLNAAGSDIIIADNDTLNVGGYGGGSAFNVIGDSVVNNNTADGDNDLYIQDELEVDGIVTIGSTTNGIQFDPAAGPTYYGTARPVRKVTLSAEYPGAILTASNSGTTNGFMTSDASSSASQNLSNFMSYYEWNSSQTAIQDYTVAVRVTLPDDFAAWETSNALQIYYNTELTTNTGNKLDVRVYNSDISLSAAQASTPVAMRVNQTSASQRQWNVISIDDSELDAGNTRDLDAAGETAIIYLKLYSKDNNYTQVGDIVLNYRSNK